MAAAGDLGFVKATDLTPEQRRMYYDLLENEYPKLWAKCYPRIYEEPRCGQYYSPKTVAREIAGVGLKFLLGVAGQSEKYEFLIASQLARFSVPTFWISRDMVTAIQKTIPPVELDWYDMHLPFEACAFYLPKGSLVHPQEGDISFIAYARFRKREMHESPLIPGHPYGSLNGAMMLICKTEGGGHLMHWNIPLDEFPVLNVPDLEGAVMRYASSEYEHRSGWWYSPQMTHEDNHMLVGVGQVIFGALLLMMERPDLVTTGRLIKRVQKSNKPKREFWSPNVLGEHYQIRHEGVSLRGTHASPRMHWVRGSYKQQAHGPQRTLRKRIWIEPYLRGLEEA